MDRCKLCGDSERAHSHDAHPFIPINTPRTVVIRWPWPLTALIVVLVLAAVVVIARAWAGQ